MTRRATMLLRPAVRSPLLLLPATALLAGCRGGSRHSTLDPAGPQAGHIDWLWWLLLIGCTLVFVVVSIAIVVALFRHHDTPDREHVPAAAGRRITGVIAAALGVTVLVLLVFFTATVWTDRQLAGLERADDVLTITVTGRQWWWEVRYEHPRSSEMAVTANEIHVPVGGAVRLKLVSADVIHSFWVPALHGKRDLIPGHENELWIQADRAGVFEGQCAEFCGYQHAHMRIRVIAQPRDEFEAWLAAQRRPARVPETPQEKRGQEVFLAQTCVMCHTVRGTRAASRAGPDLTHLASRRTLAAGAIPNTRGHLAGWTLDPQGIKPGNHMPPHRLPAEDLHALLDYLQSLQ